MRHRIAVLLTLSLLLAACAQPASNGTILSPDELPGGVQGPTVRDIADTSATIEFTTGVSTICALAYGTDEAYGTLDQMLMMEGAVRS